jgi:Ran GTPase-activating protein (RanGAP) involved in mRNA processing and transport
LQECDHGLNVNFGNASENQIKELMHILSSKKGKLRISKLDLCGSRLTVSSLQALESAVRGDVLAELENLYLEGSLTSDADTNAKWLATLSDHCPNLERLDLSNNNLGVPGASALAKLHVSDQLCLNETNLGDNGLTILVKRLKDIDSLELADNDLHASAVSYLADAICSGELKVEDVLDLSNNPLGLEGTTAVGRMLSSSHCTLYNVYLSSCDLTTAGGGLPSTDSISCEAVGEQLCQMPQTSTIDSLHLSHNSFTGDGIHILAGFMHLCPRLKYLYTCNCGITSDDLIWLLGKLKSSFPGLREWYLWDNQIDGRGVSVLMGHLPSLFPILWCDKFMFGISIPLANNSVMHNNEVTEWLKEELARYHREREKRLEEEVYKEVS